MKQSLTLGVRQQLAMTPQLQQAIRLMRLSATDLAIEIREAIEANPMLEAEDELEGDAPSADMDAGLDGWGHHDSPAEAAEDGWGEANGEDIALEPAETTAIPQELPVDTRWEDLYQPSAYALSTPPREHFEPLARATESLTDHLLWQLNVLTLPERDRLICATIVEAVDADGMLRPGTTTPDPHGCLKELAAALDLQPAVEIDEVAAMLKLVQQFEPAGVAARDLRECLLLQLAQTAPDTLHRAAAQTVLERCFDALAAGNRAALARRSKLDAAALDGGVALIQSLNPRPGTAFGDFACEYVEPDVYATKEAGRWLVELNSATAPAVRINSHYAGLVRRGDTSADNAFLRDHLDEARGFLTSLKNRNETLLKVATQIVLQQRAFLEHGAEAMRPLVLADIAAATDLHESTVSRLTTSKYMHTPQGVFELKYFFSSHVGASDGGTVSSTAIRALIKQLIGEENPQRPLSDSRLAAMLAERDIEVARRTVAKYRESLAIPSSNQRKRLA